MFAPGSVLAGLAREWADRDDLGALTVTEQQQRWRLASELPEVREQDEQRFPPGADVRRFMAQIAETRADIPAYEPPAQTVPFPAARGRHHAG